MKTHSIVAFGPIITNVDESRDLYATTLGLPLKEEANHYFHSDSIEGVQNFALMPLSLAATICYNTEVWPEETLVPQAWIEFAVDDIAVATEEVTAAGYNLLVANQEGWGQRASWFLSPEGILTKLSA